MFRRSIHLLAGAVFLSLAGSLSAQTGSRSAPLVCELVINGESFRLPLNRIVDLKSQKNPGTAYQVALRISPIQQYTLNSLRFDYDWPVKIEDDGFSARRTVQLKYKFGVDMTIVDLGGTIEANVQDQVLKILVKTVTDSLKKLDVDELVTGEPHSRKTPGAELYGTVIRYRSADGSAHMCVVYVVRGKEFAASCTIQYLSEDHEAVREVVKRTLDSFQAVSVSKPNGTPGANRPAGASP